MPRLTRWGDTMAGYWMRRLGLSVIGLALLAAPALAFEKSAGPIWNNADAQGKCPAVCQPGTWDGNWRTVVPGMDSVCSCHNPQGWVPPPPPGWTPWGPPPPPRTRQVNAGPIWNNADAQTKCPRTCGGPGNWDGNWRTIGPGQSTCDCYVRW